MCQVGDIVLFLVTKITTEISSQDAHKETWEEFYGIPMDSCCENHYFQVIEKSSDIKDSLVLDSSILSNANLVLRIHENCIFKKSYIKCNTEVFAHFFNCESEKIVESFNTSAFNIPIQTNFHLSLIPQVIKFCYGGVEDFSTLRCDLLYDEIIFQNTSRKTYEYNFKNFLSDSLHTCFCYQKYIKKLPSEFFENDQRLLHLSIYI